MWLDKEALTLLPYLCTRVAPHSFVQYYKVRKGPATDLRHPIPPQPTGDKLIKTTPLEYLFTLEMKVRDYECDLQGVVNNANYQHYMEHTRHEFLESLGVNFGKMHEDGLDAFVTKVSISYKKSLRSGDHYRSALRCAMRAPKLVFYQDILHLDGSLAARGEVECVVVDNGRLTRGEFFADLLRDVLPQDAQ